MHVKAIGEDVQQPDRVLSSYAFEGVRLLGQLVGVRGLATATPCAVLADEAIPFEGRQVAPYAVVGQVQNLGRLVDGSGRLGGAASQSGRGS